MKNNNIILASLSAVCLAYGAATQAAVPNTFTAGSPANAADVNQNFANLDQRLAILEAAGPSTPNQIISVDCDTTPDFFIGAQFLDNATAQTTYDISGTCNGPVLIYNDDVTLNGVGLSPRITIPAAIDLTQSPDAERATVVYQGASRGIVSNLTLDANDHMAEATQSGTLYALDSYVTTFDVRSEGSVFGVAPYRNAYIRAEGNFLEVDDFLHSGLTVGDQSAMITNAATTVTTTRTDGSYIDAIEAASSGHINIRGELIVNVPASTDTLFPVAVYVSDHSYVYVAGSPTVLITGTVQVNRTSTFRIDGGTVNGFMISGDNSYIECNNANQIGAGNLLQAAAARIRLFECNIESDISATSNSTFRMFGGTTTANIRVASGSFGRFNDITQTGTDLGVEADNGRITLLNSSVGDLSLSNGASVKVQFSSSVDEVFSASGSIANFYDSSIASQMVIDDGSVLNMFNTNLAASSSLSLYNAKAIITESVIGSAMDLNDGSSIRAFDTTLQDNLSIRSGSFASLGNITQSNPNAVLDVNNGRLTAAESDLGFLELFLSATADIFQGSIKGGNANTGSAMSLTGVSVTGDLATFNHTTYSMGFDDNNGGSLNGNAVYLCGNEFNGFIDGFDAFGNDPVSGFAATGAVSDGCPP